LWNASIVNDDLLVQRILEVLNDGDRVATYKLALLLAIIEWVTTNPSGEQIPTRDLAEIVLAQYFRQVRPFPNAGGELLDLQQGSNPKLAILSAATRLAATYPQLSRIDQIKTQDQSLYNSAVRDVEATLVGRPIPRLQTVGKTHIPFLYQWNWKTKQALGPIKAAGEDHLSLVPGVRESLVGLGPLLRPIIEQFWVWDVATWSKIETQEVELRAHLFGSKRASFPKKLVSGLSESQDGKCFYCASSIAMSGEVDHFVPWSKFPNDAIENLVLACKKCNGKKSDHLCVPQFAERWLSRPDEELARIATTSHWDTDPRRSRAIAANIYGSLVAGSVVWAGGDGFVEIEKVHISSIQSMFGINI
jgi:hypothetical protein